LKISKKLFSVFCCLSLSFILCLAAIAGDIAIYGDSQHNPEIQRKLVQTILFFKPSVVFRTGDIIDNGGDPKLWEAFRDIHGPLLKTTEYFPALGNHERNSPLYYRNFGLPDNRRWYSLDRFGIHFVVLDSNSKLDPGSEQYKWLESDLETSGPDAKFIIAIFHHPLFDVAGRHKSDEKKIKRFLLPVFKRHGVSAVFSGHSHVYERFKRKGIYFIVTGGGGSNLDRQTRPDPHLLKFRSVYHFCLLRPEDNFLTVKVIDIDSNTIDEFKMPARRQAH